MWESPMNPESIDGENPNSHLQKQQTAKLQLTSFSGGSQVGDGGDHDALKQVLTIVS